MSLLVMVLLIEDNVPVSDITDYLIVEKGVEMKRNYTYEKEMLHWLDGGEVEQSCLGGPWWPFDNCWAFTDDWQYRIAEPDLSRNVLIGVTNNDAPLAEQQLWLYVNTAQSNADDTTYAEPLIITDHRTYNTIGKIRMENV